MKRMKNVLDYGVIVGLSALYAMVYELFVFPNNFAPSGINGIATMIQYVFHINVGFLSMLVNIPLALLIYFKVDKRMAIRSGVYVVVFSLCLLLYDHLPLDRFRYETDNGTSAILGPFVAGVFAGWAYSLFLRRGGRTGGMDFVAALIHKKNPEKSLMQTVFTLNVVVACASYFVYGFNMEPVILCVLYCYLTSTVSEGVLKAGKKALKVEVITDRPYEMSQEIIYRLGHTATAIPAKGMFRGKEHTILYVVVNMRQEVELERIIRKYPGSFATVSQVNAVVGRFFHVKKNGQKEHIES